MASIGVHAGLLLLAFGMMRLRPIEVAVPAPARPHANIVWIAKPDVGGGGHNGGARTLARKATPTPAPAPRPVDAQPISQPPIETAPLVAEATPFAGAIEATSTTATLGPGDGPGADNGKGSGSGPGRGTGSGEGDGYKVGNGVSAPRLVRSVKPQYTAEAMRARISGSVWLDCIIDARGQVDRCRLSRSLDPNFGLDQEAIKAARQWTFEPGIKAGQPVAVQVTIELAFSLR